ncbi:hypothetical protein PGT21_026608 [Puccinia graminis f. sp. tritici]|uniref:Uncharacterized protein n=1 Tax=Puccinia graminis f. sp. tritici TaxID=56615 RepID=A0A5B0MM80_PUCGR|nr:hypothetical protein PGT21_026608 [Puccinia graminis f. sp. tritici]
MQCYWKQSAIRCDHREEAKKNRKRHETKRNALLVRDVLAGISECTIPKPSSLVQVDHDYSPWWVDVHTETALPWPSGSGIAASYYLVIESSQTVDVARQALRLVTSLDSTSLNRPALKDELIFSATFLD